MSKRNLEWNEKKFKRYLKEGRGQGEGKDYKPWWTIQDFPSTGRTTRVLGWKTKRVHHFFSDNEARYFYLLEWEDSVIDIREHYPLLDMEHVLSESKDINFEQYKDKKSGSLHILCTSFLITVLDENGRIKPVARSFKPTYEIEKNKTLEKLEIQRRFWKEKDVDWGIVTQKDISFEKAKNIGWVHSAMYSHEERGLTLEEVADFSTVLLERLEAKKPIRTITSELDKDYNLESGTGLFLFKHLIAIKKVRVEMNRPININMDADEAITLEQTE